MLHSNMIIFSSTIHRLKKDTFCFGIAIDGPPHVVPVWFIWHDGALYWQTDPDTVKVRNLERDNRIMVSVGGKETVILRGRALAMSSDDVGFDFVQALWDKYPKHMQEKYATDNRILYRVDAERTDSWHYEIGR